MIRQVLGLTEGDTDRTLPSPMPTFMASSAIGSAGCHNRWGPFVVATGTPVGGVIFGRTCMIWMLAPVFDLVQRNHRSLRRGSLPGNNRVPASVALGGPGWPLANKPPVSA